MNNPPQTTNGHLSSIAVFIDFEQAFETSARLRLEHFFLLLGHVHDHVV